MPDNPQSKAALVRVGESGELVFSAHGAQFVVEVDEALERAVLEAKQIKAEQVAFAQPSAARTLPISQIQALIRAGANPTKVAERYGLNDALVRRFSASVQTEKQYAIEQFLAVPAPKESRVHNVSELVERSLAAAQIGMETVAWSATRRGLEPWKITAQFQSAGRRIHADWSWNMHTNAILPMNPTARRLMGETDHDEGDMPVMPGDQAHGITIPGDSVRSARIERTVSAWSHENEPIAQTSSSSSPTVSEMNPVRHDTPQEHHPESPQSTGRHGDTTASAASSLTPVSALGRRPFPRQGKPAAATPRTDLAASRDHERSTTSLTSPLSSQHRDQQDRAHQDPQPLTDAAPATHETRADAAKGSKRRSGRSAVPSWDEILFGES